MRSDSTTRNARKAARLAHTYDDLEARIETIKGQEELAAVRPELDGNEIGEILGVSESRVCQIHTAMKKTLRQALQADEQLFAMVA